MSELPWWLSRRDELLQRFSELQNAYVYHLPTISDKAQQLKQLNAVDRVLFAMKANFNADVLQCLHDNGVDFDCVSPGEVKHLQQSAQVPTKHIVFTPNFAEQEEYAWALEQGLCLTLDNLYPLQHWPHIFRGRELVIRLDPEQGGGHHSHVVTVGANSKFGVSLSEVAELKALCEQLDVSVIGFHAHSGSGITEADNWLSVARILQSVANDFPQCRVLDIGGGFGVPHRPDDQALNIEALGSSLGQFKSEFPQYGLWLEPGRFLVSEAGVLLTRVTQTKSKGQQHYVGVTAGMNALIRPALYDAYHHIVNLSRIEAEPNRQATVVGPICETGDKLGVDCQLPECAEGDVLLIANAGAYARVMASNYNLRDIPPELVLS